MKASDVIGFLRLEREIQDLLGRMDRQFFMRYALSPTELDTLSQDIDQDIFREARKRFLQKTEQSQNNIELLSITPDSRRKMLVRNFKSIQDIRDATGKVQIPEGDKIGNLFKEVIHEGVDQFHEFSDSELFQLYEITRMVIEALGFLDSFDKVLGEWTRREGVRRFEFLCPDDFVNRKLQIEQIADFIVKDNKNKPIMIVHGIGGVGKTALIAKAILRQRERFQSETLLPIYFDFDDNKYRGDLAFYIFFEACQQIEAFIQDGKEKFSGKRKSWIDSNRRRSKGQKTFEKDGDVGGSALFLAQEFSDLLKSFDTEGQCILFIFDSLETHLQVDVFHDKLVHLFRALTSAFEGDDRFRCIIASRTRAETLPIRKSLIVQLDITDLDMEYSVKFLSKKIKPKSSFLLEQVFEMVGGNPLNLKVAANLLQKYFEDGRTPDPIYEDFLSKDLRQSFRADLDSNLVRERLYNRILDTFDDKRVRRIVHPGFILRKIDRKIFKDVLQPFLVESLDDEISFDEFNQEVSSFESVIHTDDEQQTLYLNPEIRKIAVELMLKDKPKACHDICERAIRFYQDLEEKGKSRPDQLRARAEQVYYHLLNGTAGSKIDQLCEPDCLKYISFDHGLPDRGKAWLIAKNSSQSVVPLDWIEQSGAFEKNRLLSRATTYFFKRNDLTKMQKYFNEMNPTASFENCVLACDIELSYLNFDPIFDNIKIFLYKNKSLSQRNYLALSIRAVKAYIMSGRYMDGIGFVHDIRHGDEGIGNIEKTNLLYRETVDFFVLYFALLVLAKAKGEEDIGLDNDRDIFEDKEGLSQTLESLFLEMPRRNFNRNNDLALQYILLEGSEAPELYVRLLESIGVQSVLSDLRWLLEKLAAAFSQTARRKRWPISRKISTDNVDLDFVKRICIQLAFEDQRMWTKAISVLTFRQFERSSDLAKWFNEWFLSQEKKESKFHKVPYRKVDSPYKSFDLRWASRANKGELSNHVVQLSRCSGQLKEYVEAIAKEKSISREDSCLPQFFLRFMNDVRNVTCI